MGPQPYKMSFSTGGLFITESLTVAALHRRDEPWDRTLTRAMAESATQLPKAASNRRSLREIVNRLQMLSEAELTYLVEEADRGDQQALLWVAVCRAYRLVREFATEIVQDRYLGYQMDVTHETFDNFFEAKLEWHDELSDLSASTRSKVRQVLFRMMREAGILSRDNQILPAFLSSRVRMLIEQNAPQDLDVFPGSMRGIA